uniref:rhodanese-like domain-containing protein n=1 Tax=Pararhizobium sp. IMCC3301 TaxID=3067904 RepID=UPI002741AE9E|nr:rhodanese-like domain-containing protein [Pararhizobium sp. IMCC3301]
MKKITAQSVKPLLTDGAEIAFLDIREHGQYGEGHPFLSVHLPYSKIETYAPKLIPCKQVRCVLLDNGDGVSERAFSVLENLGYMNVIVLDGGAPAWEKASYNLFKGVNVPSKAFGELVERELQTKSVTADELHKMQVTDENVIVLDGRSGEEFNKLSLPKAMSCPNAELGYRLPTLCSDPKTKVVVNCAGRTRSIIGAQTLVLLETPNPVYALQNGTQGWRLAGYELDHGSEISNLPEPSKEDWESGLSKALELQEKYGLQTIENETAQAWLRDPAMTTYLFDVRTREEYDAGHAPRARFAPGGQLVQATDEQLAVRNARIILSCDNGLRSATTAIWLIGMGHQVWLLDIATPLDDMLDLTSEPVRAKQTIGLDQLREYANAGTKILDASPGLSYREGHIKGSKWVTRARINFEDLGSPEDWVITGSCRILIGGIVADVEAATGKTFKGVVKGTQETWAKAGLEVVATPDEPSEEECIDYLFFVHDRHDGNLEAARRYLEWELGLLAQMDQQEKSVLNPLLPAATSRRINVAT